MFDERASERKIFPAPAGMSRCNTMRITIELDFPRTCGDEPPRKHGAYDVLQFSPHLRG